MAADWKTGRIAFKPVGDSRLRDAGSVRELDIPYEGFGLSGQQHGPLPTGSLSLDLATGIGGFGRGNVICLRYPEHESGSRLLRGVMGKTQRSGRVGVVDLGSEVTPATTRRSMTSYQNLLLVRTGHTLTALESAIELVRNGSVDLLVVSEFMEGMSRWIEQLAESERGAAATLVEELAQELTASTRESATSLVISAPAMGGDPFAGHYDVDLVVRPTEPAVTERLLATDVVIGGADEARTVSLHLLPDGSVEPVHDLIESGMQTNLIEPRGKYYTIYDTSLARGALESRLRGDADLRLQLQGELEGKAIELRWGATPGQAPEEPLPEPPHTTSESGVAPVPEPEPPAEGRFVNTWFEGEDPVLPLQVGRPTRLRLNIGPRPDDASVSSTPFEREPAADKPVWLLVSVYSEDFEIRPRSRRLLLPPAPLASKPAAFTVTARRSGELVLRVLICTLRELELLQELEVDARAAEASVAQTGAR